MFAKAHALLISILFIFLMSACSSLDKAELLHQQGQGEKALDMASDFIESGEPAERVRAANLIGDIGTKDDVLGKKAGKILTEHLNDSATAPKNAIIKGLGKIAYAPASETLVAMVPEVSGETFEILGKTLRQIGDPAIELLVEKYHSPSQKTNQDKHKKMLIFIGPVVTESITKSMESKSYFENQGNFEILISIRNPKVASMLIPYIEDEAVAHLVVEGLTQLGSLAIDPVIQKLQAAAKSPNAVLKERLVKVLGQLKDPRATVLLETLAQDESELVRIAVERALFQIRGF